MSNALTVFANPIVEALEPKLVAMIPSVVAVGTEMAIKIEGWEGTDKADTARDIASRIKQGVDLFAGIRADLVKLEG
mgnify:CR=1 FL=1|jgi:3D (Asp-Asp-Asp) domain-containing protein